MLRCIFCGYCEEACPVQAIVLGPEYELSDTSREKFIYTKEKLLEPLPPDVQARLDSKDKTYLAIAVFFIAAAVAILGGVGVVSFHQPSRSVLSLVRVLLDM